MRTSYKLFWLFAEFFLLLVLPVVFMMTYIVPVGKRDYVLLLVVLLVTLLAVKEKMSLKELGIRVDNIKQGILPYFVFTFIGGIVVLAIAMLLGKKPMENWWTFYHLQFAFIPISAAQELVYRSYFQNRLERFFKPWIVIIAIAFLYSGMHILWRDSLILVLTFFGGIGWGILWHKYPNLILISISHAILNYIAVLFEFFTSHLGT